MGKVKPYSHVTLVSFSRLRIHSLKISHRYLKIRYQFYSWILHEGQLNPFFYKTQISENMPVVGDLRA